MKARSNKFQVWFLLIVLSLIWGSSFILIKKGLVSYSPWQVGSLRLVIAGIVFLPHFLKNLKKLRRNQIRLILIFALFEIGIPPYLYGIAQTMIDSSIAGILNSLVPLFTLIVGILFFKMEFRIAKLAGVVLGMFGAFFLIFSDITSLGFQTGSNNIYGLFIVAATLLYGIANNILKSSLGVIDGLLLSSTSFVSMSIPALMFIVCSDFFSKSLGDPQILNSFVSIAILSIFGSALGIYLLIILVKKSDALVASYVTFLIPVFALGWALLDGEIINANHLFGLALIFLSVFIVNRKKKSRLA